MNTADIDVDSKWNQNDKDKYSKLFAAPLPAPTPLSESKRLAGASFPPDASTFRRCKLIIKIQDHPCLYFDITFFPSLPLGSRLRHSIAAYQYWNFQFQQPESAYIQVKDSNPTFCCSPRNFSSRSQSPVGLRLACTRGGMRFQH